MAKKNKNKEKFEKVIWIIKITIIAFVLSFTFSFISETTLENVNLITSIIILLVFIILGILFDLIGVAVTSADIVPFHAMNARRVKGAKVAIKFIQNADKVASICNDVVGDICGIISGSAVSIVSISLSNITKLPLLLVTLTVTALTASFTIGGKAICKNIAINKNTKIISIVSKVVSIFYRPKK